MISGHQVSTTDIQRYMYHYVGDYVDYETGKVDCAALAKTTARALGHPEWLDDPGHVIRDCAEKQADVTWIVY